MNIPLMVWSVLAGSCLFTLCEIRRISDMITKYDNYIVDLELEVTKLRTEVDKLNSGR